MKDRDYKMRIRFEQKEYYPDKYGETRVDKVLKKKLSKQYHKKKEKWLKQRSDNNAE